MAVEVVYRVRFESYPLSEYEMAEALEEHIARAYNTYSTVDVEILTVEEV